MPHQLLLADDSVTIQRVIKLTFADEDVDVLAVGDGDQAVAAIDKAPPDIVLADVAMPGRTGYDVARHIRSTPRLAHIPVVLLTGAFEPVDEARASEVGCDGVLAKPFEPEAVVTRVKELLSRPRGAASTIHSVAPPAMSVVAPVAAPAPSAVTRVVPAVAAVPTVVSRNNQPSPPPTLSASAPALQRPKEGDVDAFLERLDQAIATRVGSPRVVPRLQSEANAPSNAAGARPAPESGARSLIEAFEDLLVTPGPAPAPASVPSPVAPQVPRTASPSFTAPQLAPAAPAPTGQLHPVSPVSPATPASPPSTTRASSPVVPASPVRAATPTISTAAPELSFSNAQMDDLADRVMGRLAARLSAGTYTDIVLQVAERVVREEIEKIKRRV